MTYGPAYSEAIDGKRIFRQHERIRDFMLNLADWRTLAELADFLKYPEASISAQLRHLRKPKFGSYVVEKRHRANAGLWEYRVLPPEEGGQFVWGWKERK